MATEETQHGARYAVDGMMIAPDGTSLKAHRVVYRLEEQCAALCDGPSFAENMKPINELDCLALTSDLPAHGLMRGDVGTAVMVHGDGVAFEVEFVGYDGHTGALLTLERAQVRPLDAHDLPHARELSVA